MSTSARRRIVNDINKLRREVYQGISVMPFSQNMMYCQAIINGPKDTFWESEYPTKPPDVRFLSKMFHPNIYPDGRICLDILQNQWSALIDIASVLTSIQSLLSDPNPNSPANTIASEMYVKERNKYNSKVLECVEESWSIPSYSLPK
ncbi:Ubiquitin-conjugating enzyme family protein [Cryptosporidium meleagridis]|uniref:Ubiquitin-conjugating enzyme family protein n=1 Tax=Cryptosporidium meleagridis TaxID=93969 RepID=A0A2P4YYU5_9CRYT|nr:Ubiquitin-conjugating enzyme family protein [Cryptosporidium meleagridis]